MMNHNLIVYYIINRPIPSKIAIENRYQIDSGNPVCIFGLKISAPMKIKHERKSILLDHTANKARESADKRLARGSGGKGANSTD